MEELFKEIASRVALGVEAIAALIIAYGAAEAVIGLLNPMRDSSLNRKKRVWHRCGR
jgi:hypothetical protein